MAKTTKKESVETGTDASTAEGFVWVRVGSSENSRPMDLHKNGGRKVDGVKTPYRVGRIAFPPTLTLPGGEVRPHDDEEAVAWVFKWGGLPVGTYAEVEEEYAELLTGRRRDRHGRKAVMATRKDPPEEFLARARPLPEAYAKKLVR